MKNTEHDLIAHYRSLDEFLGHCARDKAGIGWEGWKDADIYTFTATVFQEEK